MKRNKRLKIPQIEEKFMELYNQKLIDEFEISFMYISGNVTVIDGFIANINNKHEAFKRMGDIIKIDGFIQFF